MLFYLLWDLWRIIIRSQRDTLCMKSATKGYLRSDYHFASQQYNAVVVWLWPVPNIKFESLQWKKFVQPWFRTRCQDVSVIQPRRTLSISSQRTNTSSQKHFQMWTVNVLPTSHQHTLYFGVRVCVLSAAEPDGRLRHTAQSQDDHGHQQTGHSGPSLVAARKTGS